MTDLATMFALFVAAELLAAGCLVWGMVVRAKLDKLETAHHAALQRIGALSISLNDANGRAGHWEHRGNALQKHNNELYRRASLAFQERDNAVGELEAQRLWNMGPASLRPNRRTN